MTVFIHDTAVIDQPCMIGEGTRVWHFCHVMAGAVIGRDCVLGQNVFVASSARVGNGVKVQNNVSLYDGVVLEDGVFVGPSAVFTNVLFPRAHIERKDAYSPTVVKRGATIGANATVVCGNTIGEYAFVGAGTLVARDVPAQALFFGNPGTVRGWVCRCGRQLAADFSCSACQVAYPQLGE